MQVSALDLRYKTKQIIQALERNEDVRIFCCGKLKRCIQPVKPNYKKRCLSSHPFFGMFRNAPDNLDTVMNELRRVRVEKGC